MNRNTSKDFENWPKLPKRFKEKWINALRSGNYKQGENSLVNSKLTKFCCLGVACSVVGYKNITIKNFNKNGKGFIPKNTKKLPKALWDNLDLQEKLSMLNDGYDFYGGKKKRMSFKGIADWIDKNL